VDALDVQLHLICYFLHGPLSRRDSAEHAAFIFEQLDFLLNSFHQGYVEDTSALLVILQEFHEALGEVNRFGHLQTDWSD
jgi:hypothetical protein